MRNVALKLWVSTTLLNNCFSFILFIFLLFVIGEEVPVNVLVAAKCKQDPAVSLRGNHCYVYGLIHVVDGILH